MMKKRVPPLLLALLLSLPTGALAACGEAREAGNQIEKGAEKAKKETKEQANEGAEEGNEGGGGGGGAGGY